MTDKYTEEIQERIKKLPERLRTYIARLEKEVVRNRELLTRTELGETSVSWTDYTNTRHLPDRGVVRYQFPNGNLEVALKGDKIEVRMDGVSCQLVVLPAYSNVFYAAIIGPGETTGQDGEQ